MTEKEVRVAHKVLLDLLSEFHNFCCRHNLKYYIIGGTLLGAIRHKGFIPWDVDADVAMPRDDYEKMVGCICDDFPDSYYVQNIYTEKHFYTPKTKILVRGAKKDNPDKYMVDIETGLNLDIFPLDNAPEKHILRKLQRYRIKTLKMMLRFKIKYDVNTYTFKDRIKTVARWVLRGALYPISEKSIITRLTKIMTRYNNFETKYLCSMASHYDYNKQVMKRGIYGRGKQIEFEDRILIAPDKPHEYLTQLYGDYMILPPEEKRRKMYEHIKFELDDSLKIKYCKDWFVYC